MAGFLPGVEIGQIIPFPPIQILDCQSASIQVMEEETGRRFTRRAIYIPELGRTFELGRRIKEAIYGEVVAGQEITLLDPSQPTLFRRLPLHVAIKVYNKRRMVDTDVKAEKPYEELAAMKWLHDPLEHPHIMPLYVCCHDDTNLYAVMPYLQSSELFDVIDQQGAMNEDQARVTFRQLLLAIHHLHERGVAHRDISLENTLMMTTGEQKAVVIDFGMALRTQQSAQGTFPQVRHPGICGKKSYIAPEVLSASPVLNLLTADLWSLGVVLFMLVAGVPPVDTASDKDNRFRVITSGRLALLLQHWGITHFSTALVDLLQRLLSKVESRISLQEVITHAWVCGGEGDGWFAQAVANAAAQSAAQSVPSVHSGVSPVPSSADTGTATAAAVDSSSADAVSVPMQSVVDLGAIMSTSSTFVVDDSTFSSLGVMSVDFR